mgnify:CR=1 FL=1
MHISHAVTGLARTGAPPSRHLARPTSHPSSYARTPPRRLPEPRPVALHRLARSPPLPFSAVRRTSSLSPVGTSHPPAHPYSSIRPHFAPCPSTGASPTPPSIRPHFAPSSTGASPGRPRFCSPPFAGPPLCRPSAPPTRRRTPTLPSARTSPRRPTVPHPRAPRSHHCQLCITVSCVKSYAIF